MAKKVVFLDTSIQISRNIYNPTLQKAIKEAIKAHDLVITSKYVKMEFKRAFIEKGLIYLYNLANRLEDFPLIFSKIAGLPTVQRRRINIALQSFTNFFQENKKLDGEHLEKLLLYLPHAIDALWEGFDNSVDGTVDKMKCAKGNDSPEKVGETYKPSKRCKRKDARCEIDKFFVKNKHMFESIIKELEKNPETSKDNELKKMLKSLKNALKHPDCLLDANECWKCGDAILAVEHPDESHFLTTNIKHHKMLSSCIKKKMLGLEKPS